MERPDGCCRVGWVNVHEQLMQPHIQGQIISHGGTLGSSVLGRGGCGTPAGLPELYLLTGEHCQGSREMPVPCS